jgi:excisionase family DNA binding protein
MKSQTRESKRQQVLDLRAKGLTYAAIGRELNISGEFVRQIVMEDSTPPRKKLVPPEVSGTLLTTSQAAKVLNVHSNTVRRWADSGILKTYRLGSRGDRRYRIRDVKKLLYFNY